MSCFTLKAIPTKCLKIVPSKTPRALSRQCQFSVISLGFRDVDERMIERGFDISFETIRRWVDKFGYTFTKRMMSRPERPSPGWHLDEIYTKINGKRIQATARNTPQKCQITISTMFKPTRKKGDPHSLVKAPERNYVTG